MFNFTKYSIVYYSFSGILIAASIAALVAFGLKFGIEFTGGGNMEIEFLEQRPANVDISNALAEFNLGDVQVQPVGEKGAVLRFKEVDETTHASILAKLNEVYQVQETNFQYIGPSVGNELKNKTVIAIVLVLLMITLYITFAFRKVSRPVASWKYGLASLVALFHDILIPLGMFAVLGKWYNVEITTSIVAALLTVLGFSVHDTIVIFDRIRENIMRAPSRPVPPGRDGVRASKTGDFAQTVNESLRQTVGRSISTVATTLFVMIAIFFFGGHTLKYFALALIVGIASGAYSSIFIAGPLLVAWQKWSEKRA